MDFYIVKHCVYEMVALFLLFLFYFYRVFNVFSAVYLFF